MSPTVAASAKSGRDMDDYTAIPAAAAAAVGDTAWSG